MEVTERVELCPFCHKPMQVADRVFDKENKVIALRYVCNCRGTLITVNWHAGDRTRRE